MLNRGGLMSERSKRSFLPFLMMIVGLVLILGAVATILVLRGGQTQTTAETQAGEETLSDIPRVTLDEANTAFDSGEAVIVDVRGAEYYAMSHIPTARSIPLNELEFRMGELNPKDWIILYCT